MSPVSWSDAADDEKKHSSRTGLVFKIFMCAAVVAAILFIPEVGTGVLETSGEVLRWLGLISAGFLLLFAVLLSWRARNDHEDGRPVRYFSLALVGIAVALLVMIK